METLADSVFLSPSFLSLSPYSTELLLVAARMVDG